jgi:hypothetical protein
MTPMSKDVLLGEASRQLGYDTWQLQRLLDRKLYGPVRRCGRYRVLSESELPAVREALTAAGYRPRSAAAAAKVG